MSPEETTVVNGPQSTTDQTVFLSRDQILSSDDLKTDVVEVPEWGGSVFIQELSAFERDSIDSEMVEIRMRGRQSEQRVRETALATYRIKLAAAGMVDPGTRKRIFSEKDIKVLGAKSATALAKVSDAVRKLSGIEDEDVEEVLGNSEGDQDEPSPTD